MKHTYVLLGASLAASAFALAAQPAPVVEVSGQSLSQGSSVSLVEKIEVLERKLEARNKAQIDLQRQLTTLQSEVDEIRGITELHTHNLEQILERQRELYQELDKRVSEAMQAPAAIASTESTLSSNTLDYSSDLTENQAYDFAVNLVLKDKQYDQAITKFIAFNKKYPQSTYAANAHYWLGQLLFTKGSLAEASDEFSIVINQYKDSSKRSDALLKLAMVAEKQNDKTRARNLYSQLLKEYPSSSAAQLASPRLEQLK